MITHPRNFAVFSIALAAALSSVNVAAQTADTSARPVRSAPPVPLTQDEIARRLRQSGLSQQQVQERLRSAGYDPAIADRYFQTPSSSDSAAAAGRFGRIARPIPPPDGNLLTALRRIGVLTSSDSVLAAETVRSRRRAQPDSMDRRPRVFGQEFFSAASTEFHPMLTGPVDSEYVLGPGDKLMLILTGDVEQAYELPVTPEGFIVVPDVGRVVVAGLTVDELKRRMNERLARVYSGVQVGTINFDVSVGELRRLLVYVTGEAFAPAAYPVTGGATVFNALYQAGGPGENGSFRSIEIRRKNTVRRVDLYDYLLRGDKSGDIRLEQGDIIFVPGAGPRVTVEGSIRRPAIYELKPGETLDELLAYAGGVQADAALERIQVDRILPLGQRAPGRERVIVDVPTEQLRGNGNFALVDGDHITVLTISTERRNRVRISGDVYRPGNFEFRRGMTVGDLIRNAAGLAPTAYMPAAHVRRLNPADSTTQLIQVVLDDASAPNHASRVLLEDLDEVTVFGRPQLVNPQTVSIHGLVKREGDYPFSEGMTAHDIVLMAGGFQEGAIEFEVEVARRPSPRISTDTLATLFRVPLQMGLKSSENGGVKMEPFALKPGDIVFVRPLPGYKSVGVVQIAGEVALPGPYAVESKKERISNLIRRAGGVTADGYAGGFRLYRNGKQVGVNLLRALARPGGADDLFIEPGDRMEVPRYDGTVLVTGAVAFETRVRYEPGLDIDDYLQRAGGLAENGDRKRTSVRYPNGELRTTRRLVAMNRNPKVEPGSTITVPVKTDPDGTNWDEILTRSLTVASTLATLLLSLRALDNN